jgi:hypothetical protein
MHDLHHRIDHACPGVAHYSLLLCWAKERIGEEGRGKEKEWDEVFVYFLCFPTTFQRLQSGRFDGGKKSSSKGQLLLVSSRAAVHNLESGTLGVSDACCEAQIIMARRIAASATEANDDGKKVACPRENCVTPWQQEGA